MRYDSYENLYVGLLLQIREIVHADEGYSTRFSNYVNDIVVLILKTPVVMNKFVLPACLEWTSDASSAFQPADGTPGKVGIISTIRNYLTLYNRAFTLRFLRLHIPTPCLIKLKIQIYSNTLHLYGEFLIFDGFLVNYAFK